MILNSPYITGSITVTGNANVQGTLTVTGSLSGTATSASLASNSNLLQGTGSVGFSTTASLLEVSSSQQQISASLLNVIANYATTGSNSFRANQSITGSLVVSSTITAQTLVVQTVTSSIVYSSGSNIFGNQSTDRQTFTGSVNITGSITQSGANNTSSFAGIVGINNTAPSTQLHIVGTGGNIFADGLRVTRDGVPSQYAILNMVGGGYNFLATNSTTGEPAFTWLTSTNSTSYSTKMSLNLGTYMLDVSGSGRFTGAAMFSGSVTTLGNITIQKTAPNILMKGGYAQDLAFFLNTEPSVYLVDDATATKGIKVNISTGAFTQLGSGASTFASATTFNGNTLALNGNNPSFTFNTSAANLYNYISFGAGSAGASIFLLGNTYNTVGPYIASGLTLTAQSGGINLNVETAAGSISLYTGTATERFRVGNIGFAANIIGASDANSKIFLGQVSSDCGLIPTPAGTTLYLYSRSGGTNYRYLATSSTYFTGQHGNKPINTDLKTNIQNYIGMIVSSAGTFYSVNPITQEVTTGKDAIKISEALPEIKLTDTDQDKAVWGVVTNVKNDNYNTDGTTEFDNNAQFGDRLGENVIRVNGLGEGAIWVTNINGNIENGDYICSSVIPGYGKKQNDDLLHNYTVAKSTMSCNFELANGGNYICQEFEFEGQIYKKAFIGCTYHCS